MNLLHKKLKLTYAFISYNHANVYLITISTKLFKSKFVTITVDIISFNI